MTTMNGKIVIAGNSIEELERELATVKALMAMGKTYGVGGNSVAEVEEGLKMVGGTPHHCCDGNCCNCGCCEDEDLYDEEDEYYEAEYDEYDEDEEDEVDLDELADDLRDIAYNLKDVLEKLGE